MAMRYESARRPRRRRLALLTLLIALVAGILIAKESVDRLLGRKQDKTGPESLLGNALFAGLARLGGVPVVVLLNGGGHSSYHDRRDDR